MSKKKGPDPDKMTRRQIVEEIAEDMGKGDRFGLTQYCDMYDLDEIVNLLPKIKLSSVKFIEAWLIKHPEKFKNL